MNEGEREREREGLLNILNQDDIWYQWVIDFMIGGCRSIIKQGVINKTIIQW